MRVLLVLAVLCVSAVQARAFSLGTNLGVTFLSPDDIAENYTLVSLPSHGFLTVLGPPGIRVGVTSNGSAHEVFFDTGFFNLRFDDGSFSVLQLTANYQYNFSPQGTGAYLTAGGGLARSSQDNFFTSGSDTGSSFGAGIGVRHRLGHGHGTLRGELRYDRLIEGSEGDFVDADAVALKFGFDVWMD